MSESETNDIIASLGTLGTAQYLPCTRDDDGKQVYNEGDSDYAVLLKKCEASSGF